MNYAEIAIAARLAEKKVSGTQLPFVYIDNYQSLTDEECAKLSAAAELRIPCVIAWNSEYGYTASVFSFSNEIYDGTEIVAFVYPNTNFVFAKNGVKWMYTEI